MKQWLTNLLSAKVSLRPFKVPCNYPLLQATYLSKYSILINSPLQQCYDGGAIIINVAFQVKKLKHGRLHKQQSCGKNLHNLDQESADLTAHPCYPRAGSSTHCAIDGSGVTSWLAARLLHKQTLFTCQGITKNPLRRVGTSVHSVHRAMEMGRDRIRRVQVREGPRKETDQV